MTSYLNNESFSKFLQAFIGNKDINLLALLVWATAPGNVDHENIIRLRHLHRENVVLKRFFTQGIWISFNLDFLPFFDSVIDILLVKNQKIFNLQWVE